jgi:hypothetical protein
MCPFSARTFSAEDGPAFFDLIREDSAKGQTESEFETRLRTGLYF